ncbi:hypothetical protein ACHAXT_003269 [Thalassiosira profunda]
MESDAVGQSDGHSPILTPRETRLLQYDEGNEYQRWDIRANFLGVVVMCVGLPVATSIFLWWLSKILSERINLFKEQAGGRLRPPRRGLKSELLLLSSTFSLWYAITLSGAIMFAVSYSDIFELLSRYLPLFNWELVTRFLEVLCIIIVVLDTVFTVLIWMPSIMLQKRMWNVYYRLAGDTETSKRYKVLHPIPFKCLQAGYIVCFGFLLLSMMLAVLFVVVSVAVVGFSYGFSEACYTASDPLDGVCIDLTALGGDEIQCGYEFEQFCIGGMSFYQHVTINHLLSSLHQSIECREDGRNSDQSSDCPQDGERVSSAVLNVTPLYIGTMGRSSGASSMNEASSSAGPSADIAVGVEAADELGANEILDNTSK